MTNFKYMKIQGIVLAGGKSSRMGQEKGLVKFRGKPLVEYAVEALSGICDSVVISTANPGYAYMGLTLIEDEIPDCGPLGGIYSCMKQEKADLFLVLSCDLPFVTPDLLSHLVEQYLGWDAVVPMDFSLQDQPRDFSDPGEQAADKEQNSGVEQSCNVSAHIGKLGVDHTGLPSGLPGRMQPLCAAYGKECLTVIERSLLSGDFKMMRLLDKIGVKVVGIWKDSPLYYPNQFLNVNSPGDISFENSL